MQSKERFYPLLIVLHKHSSSLKSAMLVPPSLGQRLPTYLRGSGTTVVSFGGPAVSPGVTLMGQFNLESTHVEAIHPIASSH